MLELSDLAVCSEISRWQTRTRWIQSFSTLQSLSDALSFTTYKAPSAKVKRNSFSLRIAGVGDASETLLGAASA